MLWSIYSTPLISVSIAFFPASLTHTHSLSLPPFIYKHTYAYFSYPIGNLAEPQRAGKRGCTTSSRTPAPWSHSVVVVSLQAYESIVSPFPVYEYIQNYNTQPYGTKEILIDLLNPRTSKRHCGGYGYFSSVNTNPM